MRMKLLRVMNSMRAQLIVIAIAVALTASMSGLMAYLVDYEDYTATFLGPGPDEFGIELTGNKYESLQGYSDEFVIPGQEIELDLALRNNGKYDLYAFVELNIPEGFNGEVGPEWENLRDNIYYYKGTANTIQKLKQTDNNGFVRIMDSVTVDTAQNTLVDNNQTFYQMDAKAYAIQADYIEQTEPELIWEMARTE